MKTIIAGGRDYELVESDYELLESIGIAEVVCGGATGADEYGKRWAVCKGIPVKMFPADWEEFGKAAGPIRNRQMAQYADRLVAFWDGKSRGTKNMIDVASALGLEVVVVRTDKGGA